MTTSLLERITIDPEICHGKPCIRGLRYPVGFLLELLSSEMTHAAILEDYDDLEAEDFLAVLLYSTQAGEISIGKAAVISGYPKRDFMEMLGKNGISIFAYSPEELRADLEL
ncbi:DUF433 domain-containing protein [Phormidium sp. FACHB-1136]|uniref:DUF433 domain-containing protein n=1 Tax=Phormidium sp. FACHB-1136 TaxID=2692848 RepID=UPI0016845DB2|nr:DUF433 domain-containing protein [Phormidium sp. FACHB-1136]MBD2425804.1 DUF433 domain-containing protein [Phormidium sp. FACHB-1136]